MHSKHAGQSQLYLRRGAAGSMTRPAPRRCVGSCTAASARRMASTCPAQACSHPLEPYWQSCTCNLWLVCNVLSFDLSRRSRILCCAAGQCNRVDYQTQTRRLLLYELQCALRRTSHKVQIQTPGGETAGKTCTHACLRRTKCICTPAVRKRKNPEPCIVHCRCICCRQHDWTVGLLLRPSDACRRATTGTDE